jgi:hypothetical protein
MGSEKQFVRQSSFVLGGVQFPPNYAGVLYTGGHFLPRHHANRSIHDLNMTVVRAKSGETSFTDFVSGDLRRARRELELPWR